MIANLNEVSAEAILIRDDDNGIATLTLNRPEQFNALSSDLLSELQAALDDISADTSIRVVIINANGRGFCAGHDLKEVRSSVDKAFHQALFDRCSKMMLTINSYISFYQSYAADQWRNLTPETYIALLSLIGFIGWVTMKSGTKRI